MKVKIWNSRKGISTIIGGFVFLVLMAGAFTAFVAAIQFHNDLIVSQAKVSSTEISKTQEEFTGSASIENNRLTLDVANTGSVDLEIDSLWFINKTMTGEPYLLREINFDEGLIPIGKAIDILNGDVNGIKDGTYNLKIVSSRGNFETIEDLIVANGGVGGSDCEVKAYVIPPNIAQAGDVLLVAHVFNKGTSSIFDLTPSADPDVDPAAVDSVLDGPDLTTPTSLDELREGESFVFAWSYKLTGAVGSIVEFTINDIEGKSTDGAAIADIQCDSADASVKIVKPVEDKVLQSELTQKPEIFLVFPGPVGDATNDDSRGWWGIIIVNPTNHDLIVSKVSIQAISSAGSSFTVFKAGEGALTQHFPTSGWSVPEDNVLQWQNVASPITIPAISAEEFVVKIRATAGEDPRVFTIAANTHTDMGQFAKVGHTSTIIKDKAATTIVNVYPTSAGVQGSTAHTIAADNDFQAFKTITSGDPASFFITVREGQDSGSERIDGGDATLIINIPVGFPNVSAADNQGSPQCFGTVTTRTFADGAKQLRVPIAAALGETSSDADRCTFTFTANAPNVDEDRLYIIYSFIQGVDTDNNPLGAVAEAYVLKVEAP